MKIKLHKETLEPYHMYKWHLQGNKLYQVNVITGTKAKWYAGSEFKELGKRDLIEVRKQI